MALFPDSYISARCLYSADIRVVLRRIWLSVDDKTHRPVQLELVSFFAARRHSMVADHNTLLVSVAEVPNVAAEGAHSGEVEAVQADQASSHVLSERAVEEGDFRLSAAPGLGTRVVLQQVGGSPEVVGGSMESHEVLNEVAGNDFVVALQATSWVPIHCLAGCRNQAGRDQSSLLSVAEAGTAVENVEEALDDLVGDRTVEADLLVEEADARGFQDSAIEDGATVTWLRLRGVERLCDSVSADGVRLDV